MCMTSLPYCPPQHSHQIASLIHAAAAIDAQTQPTPPLLPLSPSAAYSPISPQNEWLICEHPSRPHANNNNNNNNNNQTPPKTPQASKPAAPTTTTSTSPSTCPNIEIRHPSFSGTRCIRCTNAARAAAAAQGVSPEEKGQMEMVRKLEEEIARLEGVVANMKRKLRSLTLVKEKREDEGETG